MLSKEDHNYYMKEFSKEEQEEIEDEEKARLSFPRLLAIGAVIVGDKKERMN